MFFVLLIVSLVSLCRFVSCVAYFVLLLYMFANETTKQRENNDIILNEMKQTTPKKHRHKQPPKNIGLGVMSGGVVIRCRSFMCRSLYLSLGGFMCRLHHLRSYVLFPNI